MARTGISFRGRRGARLEEGHFQGREPVPEAGDPAESSRAGGQSRKAG